MFKHIPSGIFAAAMLSISAPAAANSIIFASAGGSTPATIPTLSTSLLILLSVVLGLVAVFMIKKHPGSGMTPLLALLLTGAVASSAGGIISHAHAQQVPEHEQIITNPNGGTFLLAPGINRFLNNAGAPLRVIKIEQTTYSCQFTEANQCNEGNTLNKGASCEVVCFGVNKV